jgi:integrase
VARQVGVQEANRPRLRHAGGKRDNRNNVRRRLLVKAIEAANKELVELGIEPIGQVSPHGLRRTFASLRCAIGDDVAYTAALMAGGDRGVARFDGWPGRRGASLRGG